MLKIVSMFFLLGMLASCASDTSFHTPSPQRATSRPYKIKGAWYYPQRHYEKTEVGIASFYGMNDGFHGEKTASGERFLMHKMTAAHKTLPLPCVVRVTNLENGRTVILKVNDRGPFKHNRIIDVSVAAAKRLGFYRQGLAKVRVETLIGPSLRLAENRKRFAQDRGSMLVKVSSSRLKKRPKKAKNYRIEDLLRF